MAVKFLFELWSETNEPYTILETPSLELVTIAIVIK